MITVLRTIIGVSLVIGCYCLVRHAARTKIISGTIQKAYDQLSEQARVQSRQYRLQPEGEDETGMYRLGRKLQYSGLRSRYPFLTPVSFLLIETVSAAVGYFLMRFLTDNPFLSILALACAPAALHLCLTFLCYANYRKTENELLVLLNLLESYSITASELTGILYRISSYVGEPIKTALEECYFETQTTGDIAQALEHLAHKLEHPQFGQLVRSLRVSSQYDADYSQVVKGSRKSVQDYLSYRKKRKTISNEAKTEMVLLGLAGVITITMMGRIIEQSGLGGNVWAMLFQTGPGIGMLAFMALVLLLFFWQAVLFDKD